MVNKLGFDLYTYVVDSDEWNDLSLAFLKASVTELDALSDIALVTTLYLAAENIMSNIFLIRIPFELKDLLLLVGSILMANT
jgi:hypothetical protein